MPGLKFKLVSREQGETLSPVLYLWADFCFCEKSPYCLP